MFVDYCLPTISSVDLYGPRELQNKDSKRGIGRRLPTQQAQQRIQRASLSPQILTK